MPSKGGIPHPSAKTFISGLNQPDAGILTGILAPVSPSPRA
ncbi:hypothetical protein GWL_20560 [Herbaspirillum sp. GW103]|jgi:hypothetical protein|nr:hypothetical protein GWL_20560 [Herbaspirillum sp. GW103]